jgi:hypothetical protein
MGLLGRGSRNGKGRNASGGAGKSGGKATISRVRIDSAYYSIAALDTKTVTVSGIDRDFIKGQRIHFSFVLDVNGETIEIPTRGTVHRVNGSHMTTSYMAPQPYYQRYLKQAAAAHPNPQRHRR